jgi:alkanesulfonate monooxygenase SsuD/methylene tetrahydromethanopterin reductase-like flavin-dependent oxidoreductase (luciferase family)
VSHPAGHRRAPRPPFAPLALSTALVGSYEQVAEALLEYVRIGVGTLLIRGFDPLDDARDHGNLVRIVREQVLVEA